MSTFVQKFTQNFIENTRYMYLLKGLGNTIIITVFALMIGIVLGFLVAVVRSTHEKHGGLNVLNFICKVYLTVWRGTPTVVQVMIMYYVILVAVNNKILVAVIAFGLNSAAYVAEIVRSGIMSIDEGQFEAGHSQGFNTVQIMVYIVLPQAYRSVIPTLLGQCITTIKDSSYLANVAVIELMSRVKKILSAANMYNGTGQINVSDVFVLFGVAFVIYFVINFILSCTVRYLQKRSKRNKQVTVELLTTE